MENEAQINNIIQARPFSNDEIDKIIGNDEAPKETPEKIQENTEKITENPPPVESAPVATENTTEDAEKTNDEEESEEEYEVEKILAHTKQQGKIFYLVKWKNYPDSENTWEPEACFNSRDLIKEYWKKVREEDEQKTKRKRRSSETNQDNKSSNETEKTVKSKKDSSEDNNDDANETKTKDSSKKDKEKAEKNKNSENSDEKKIQAEQIPNSPNRIGRQGRKRNIQRVRGVCMKNGELFFAVVASNKNRLISNAEMKHLYLQKLFEFYESHLLLGEPIEIKSSESKSSEEKEHDSC